MTLSKDPKRSERMRHEETRITFLVEGTVCVGPRDLHLQGGADPPAVSRA